MMKSNPLQRPTASDCLEKFFVLKSDLEKELYFSNKIVQQLKSQLETQNDNPNIRFESLNEIYFSWGCIYSLI